MKTEIHPELKEEEDEGACSYIHTEITRNTRLGTPGAVVPCERILRCRCFWCTAGLPYDRTMYTRGGRILTATFRTASEMPVPANTILLDSAGRQQAPSSHL